VATRGKGWRLAERLPGRLLLHRRRYNWDDSEDCDNDETACPCYTKGLRLRLRGGGVDDHGLHDNHGDDADTASLRSNVEPPTPNIRRTRRHPRSILIAGLGHFLGESKKIKLKLPTPCEMPLCICPRIRLGSLSRVMPRSSVLYSKIKKYYVCLVSGAVFLARSLLLAQNLKWP